MDRDELPTLNGGLIMKLWIARDKDGTLWLFESEPFLNVGNRFVPSHFENCKQIYNDSFPEVTFENSPKEVELILKK